VHDDPVQVAADLLGRLGAPDVAQRVEPDDANVALGEDLANLLVDIAPAAVADRITASATGD
jgi:hypothetical protein